MKTLLLSALLLCSMGMFAQKSFNEEDKILGSNLAYIVQNHPEELKHIMMKRVRLVDEKADTTAKIISLYDVLSLRSQYYITTYASWCAPCRNEVSGYSGCFGSWAKKNNRVIIIMMHETVNDKTVGSIKKMAKEGFGYLEIYKLQDEKLCIKRNYFAKKFPERIVIDNRNSTYKLTFTRLGYGGMDSKDLPAGFECNQ